LFFSFLAHQTIVCLLLCEGPTKPPFVFAFEVPLRGTFLQSPPDGFTFCFHFRESVCSQVRTHPWLTKGFTPLPKLSPPFKVFRGRPRWAVLTPPVSTPSDLIFLTPLGRVFQRVFPFFFWSRKTPPPSVLIRQSPPFSAFPFSRPSLRAIGTTSNLPFYFWLFLPPFFLPFFWAQCSLLTASTSNFPRVVVPFFN